MWQEKKEDALNACLQFLHNKISVMQLTASW